MAQRAMALYLTNRTSGGCHLAHLRPLVDDGHPRPLTPPRGPALRLLRTFLFFTLPILTEAQGSQGSGWGSQQERYPGFR
jgi:hypothetical protein